MKSGVPTDARLLEAQRAIAEGWKLESAGRFTAAVPSVERALILREAALGEHHPAVAAALNDLAGLYMAQGNYRQAESLYEQALMITEAALGAEHPEFARLLGNLAGLYEAQGSYARAEPLYTRALAIQRVVLGNNHLGFATSLNNLARLYKVQGRYAEAKPLHERALAIFEAALGQQHPHVATSLNNLALLYRTQGDYVRAEALFARSLMIWKAALGDDHPDVAMALNNLAGLYMAQGRYARAEPLYKQALQIQEAALGEHHPDVATSLSGLAALYVAQSDYARAEPLYKRALWIQEVVLGESHPDVATSLNNLAVLHWARGNHAHAEPLYTRALAIWEATLGGRHPAVATALHNLALLYKAQGSYARAEPLYSRALAISEAALGKDHPEVATTLTALAGLHQVQHRYEQAEPLYTRALEIQKAALGEHHPDVASSLHQLAELYREQGALAQAEPLYQQTLAIREAVLGEHHPDVASSLGSLAELYQSQGRHAQAEPLYVRALEIQVAVLGEHHPHVVNSIYSLAINRLAQRNLPGALALLERGLLASEARLRQEAFGLPEERLADTLEALRAESELLYTLVRVHPGSARIRRLALSCALLRKGRSLEESSTTSFLIYRGLDRLDREAFKELRALRSEYSTLSLAGPDTGPLTHEGYKRRLEELSRRSEALEADLARRSAHLRALRNLPRPFEIINKVAATLPGNSVLVEFVVHHSLPQGPGALFPTEPRYLALLLFPDGRTHALDLGPAAPIDGAVRRLHEALGGRHVSYEHEAQALHALVFRPLAPLLGDVRRLLLSADGQLALIPFAALHDGDDFLVDAFDITYLNSGKDLLPRPEGTPPARSVVVVADPDFSAPGAASSSPVHESARAERSVLVEPFISTLRSELADKPWLPLPGTRREAEAIQRLFPQAQMLLGRSASKQALLELETPGLLHIATHGFFLDEASARTYTRGVTTFGAAGGAGSRRLPPEPLLRSGLVLAGADAREGPSSTSRPEDSLLTALELAGLDLWGTQLVVLSACDTARGDVKPGEGVHGLRRALVMAGAETVVTSLWKVNDDTTRELMENYYHNLAAGQGRATALREAMKALRGKKPHPYYWAPFIAIGQDEPLQAMARP